MPRLRSALAAPAAALLTLAAVSLAPAGLALAAPAEGSVPSEVRAYVTDGSLVHQLDDVYGPGAAGDGVDFDDTTKPGGIERVHVWSEALRNGEETDRYVELLNEWVVPISIADEPVGLATIWINPTSVAPELASFERDADLAAALAEVPDGSALVHDVASSAWLALAEDGTLTPLVPGSTGLSTPVPIDDVAILPVGDESPPPTGDPNTGVGLAIAVLLVLLALIVVVLVLPTARKKKVAADAEAEGDDEVAEAVEPVEDAGVPAAIEAAPKKKPAKKAESAPED
jgi:hypothetical protein